MKAINSRFCWFWGTVFLVIIWICSLSSCRDEFRHYDKGQVYLEFSQDTVRFDTIFTTQTSVTHKVTVRNPSKDAVLIDRIYLKGGAMSRFRMNVSGDTGLIQNGVSLAGGDSLYVFVQTAIDYRNQDNPFEIEDFICFELNQMPVQQIVLSAWGQDAHYWKSDHVCTVAYDDPLEVVEKTDSVRFSYFEWNATDYPLSSARPYVVYGYLMVPEGQTLTIPAGCRFYFASNSGIWVRKGARLVVEGSQSQPVLFTSIRQDGDYKHLSGQWGRIWLEGESGPHKIDYAQIRNGKTGVWLDSCVQVEGGLEISNTLIENMSSHGILSKQNQVRGTNLCISESKVNLALLQGGDFVFTHCTFDNRYIGGYGSSQCLVLNDYSLASSGDEKVYPLAQARFRNSIFWGNSSFQLNVDLKADTYPDAGADVSSSVYSFENCLIRYSPKPADTSMFVNCFWNEDPYFRNVDFYDFHIDSIASKAVGNADPRYCTGIAGSDLDGNLRADKPTVGAYEFIVAEKTRLWFR